MLIALDPSICSSGVAAYRDGVLVGAATIRDRQRQPDVVAQSRRMAYAIDQWARAWTHTHYEEDWDLVTELPQAYAPGKGCGPTQDLIPMALVSGGVAHACDGAITGYLPAEWIHGLQKATRGDPRDAPRGARIWDRLSEAERKIALEALQHDAWDAIGIGLHHLGRLAPKRVGNAK